MSQIVSLPSKDKLPLYRRPSTWIVVAAARMLARLRPRWIRVVLKAIRVGAKPASYSRAMAARHAVEASSPRCASGRGCLQRSLAIVLFCRACGEWPTWCTGVTIDPFNSHAWVEAEGQPVGEVGGVDDFHKIMTVPPRRGQIGAGEPSDKAAG